MAEDNNNNISKEEIKNEAKETYNQAKEGFQSANFKEETGKGKELIINLVKKPVETIREVVNNSQNYSVIGIALIFIWLVLCLIRYFINIGTSEYLDFSFLEMLKTILDPVLTVLAFSGATYFLNKNKNHSFMTDLTVGAITFIPNILLTLIIYLDYISSNVGYLTSPIGYFLRIVTIIFQFFAVKELFGKEDNEGTFIEFVKVEGVFYIVYFILSFLGIYI